MASASRCQAAWRFKRAAFSPLPEYPVIRNLTGLFYIRYIGSLFSAGIPGCPNLSVLEIVQSWWALTRCGEETTGD